MSDPSARLERTTSSRYEPPHPRDASDEADNELLRRVAADDDLALHQFYQRYAGLVYSLAYRILRDEARAEEVLQETFIRVWRAAITFDPARGRAEAWVVTIARNLSLTALRKKRVAQMDGEAAEQIPSSDESSDPEVVAWRGTQRKLVQEAVAQLPPNQRRVVVLAYFDGLTHVEIAERTGEPLGTVKSRLRLALRRLEAILRSTLGDAWEAPLAGERREFGQPEVGR